MERDVGRDEGREQAEWRDLVARLEIAAPIDPADAPWPDRENLPGKTQPTSSTSVETATTVAQTETTGEGHTASEPPGPGGDDKPHGQAERGRVIRPAGFSRPGELAARAGDSGVARKPGDTAGPDDLAGPVGPAGPRDYEVDKPRDDDLDEEWDDRYVPPPLPPQPKLDPVAKGAWIALFGGPGYLMLATLLSWQIPGWAALASVVAFVTGFVVLVIRLGDGPSKRDGPDQGAVV